jgi:NhaA family Na+:H+ antiporter
VHDAQPHRDPLLRAMLTRFQQFTDEQSSSGVVLLVCAVVAMAWANSPWAGSYFALWQTPLAIGIGNWSLHLDLAHFINDGLMAAFFFVVGLEIKRELLVGELSKPGQAMLPLLGALGGMVGAGAVYALFTIGSPELRGWGIPVATDIAFALAVLALLGPRVPLGLKVFLAALAIADDLGAIAVIAIFYSSQVNLAALALSGAALMLAAGFNWLGIMRRWPYFAVGLVAWAAMLESGVHATVAGVLLAMCIPARARIDTRQFIQRGRKLLGQLEAAVPAQVDHEQQVRQPLLQEESEIVGELESNCEAVQLPLERLERELHGPVTFFVMPLFALANAGISLSGLTLGNELLSPVAVAIVAGLLLGKQLGVTGFTWLGVRLGLGRLPEGVTWPQVYGMSWVCGIGFTMSLFVAGLAFGGNARLLDTAKLAVLCASLLAGAGGYVILKKVLGKALPATGDSLT